VLLLFLPLALIVALALVLVGLPHLSLRDLVLNRGGWCPAAAGVGAARGYGQRKSGDQHGQESTIRRSPHLTNAPSGLARETVTALRLEWASDALSGGDLALL
jgi:hypothetical protein